MKRTIELENELIERGVAKERMAMFKNLESGTQAAMNYQLTDPKVRVDVSRIDTRLTCPRFIPSRLNVQRCFRWHVAMCRPLNGSSSRKKDLITVGEPAQGINHHPR